MCCNSNREVTKTPGQKPVSGEVTRSVEESIVGILLNGHAQSGEAPSLREENIMEEGVEKLKAEDGEEYCKMWSPGVLLRLPLL